jgi:hypothetical protein
MLIECENMDDDEVQQMMEIELEAKIDSERERIFRAVEHRMNWLGVEKFVFIKKCIYDEK